MFRFQKSQNEKIFEVDDEINIWTFGGGKDEVLGFIQTEDGTFDPQYKVTNFPNILNNDFKLANARQLLQTFASAILTVTALLSAII